MCDASIWASVSAYRTLEGPHPWPPSPRASASKRRNDTASVLLPPFSNRSSSSSSPISPSRNSWPRPWPKIPCWNWQRGRRPTNRSSSPRPCAARPAGRRARCPPVSPGFSPVRGRGRRQARRRKARARSAAVALAYRSICSSSWAPTSPIQPSAPLDGRSSNRSTRRDTSRAIPMTLPGAWASVRIESPAYWPASSSSIRLAFSPAAWPSAWHCNLPIAAAWTMRCAIWSTISNSSRAAIAMG